MLWATLPNPVARQPHGWGQHCLGHSSMARLWAFDPLQKRQAHGATPSVIISSNTQGCPPCICWSIRKGVGVLSHRGHMIQQYKHAIGYGPPPIGQKQADRLQTANRHGMHAGSEYSVCPDAQAQMPAELCYMSWT